MIDYISTYTLEIPIVKSISAHCIFFKTEKEFVRERIHKIRKNLATVDKELLNLNLKLSNKMQPQDWDKMEFISYLNMSNDLDRNKKVQVENMSSKRSMSGVP